MTDEPTCGKGLAANAPLAAKLGELTDAVGNILEAHLPSLDLTDENSQVEHALYQRLVAEHRQAAIQLGAIAAHMAGARDLAMGRHDAAAMGSPLVRSSFQRFVELEKGLLALLQRRLEEDEQMLAAMGEGAG